MKKILLILLPILCLFSFFNIAWASYIFSDHKTEIHYCRDGECWVDEWIEYIKESDLDGLEKEWKASVYVQKILAYLLTFLKLLAIILIIYAWFLMLTAVWDEEKFKKWKTIIIFTIIWLIIIYLAWPIVTFIIWIFTSA